jgi:bifunctional DNA-binding transcriptional regulator/antitoxin component of YhaV-PrlF toxin-antitoxin module
MSRKVYHHKITRAGQVSIPADVRQRWGTTLVAIEDEGDQLVVRPLPEDWVDRVRGAWKGIGDGRTSAELMAESRQQEIEAENRKWKAS